MIFDTVDFNGDAPMFSGLHAGNRYEVIHMWKDSWWVQEAHGGGLNSITGEVRCEDGLGNLAELQYIVGVMLDRANAQK